MGQRLGIDVRAVHVPRHVFSVLVTRGRNIDVETTSASGFDLDPFRREGRPRSPGPREFRREVGPPGLAGFVAFNHGITLSREKRYAESVRANLFALGLDPDNRSAARNLVAALERWLGDLVRARKFEQAMAVVSVGCELVPDEPAFQKITVAVCNAWARESIDREDWAGAADVYRRGLREYPDNKELSNKLTYCLVRIP
jgi:hypothetical protein